MLDSHGRFMKGHKPSEETRKKLSLAKKGHKFTEEHKKNISISKLGNNNPMWKGDDVGYGNLHVWVRRHKEKHLCPCGKMPYDVANISGEYKRDINDYIWLCRKCHMKSDGRLEKLIERMKKRGI